MTRQLPDKIKVGPYYFDLNEMSEEWYNSTDNEGSTVKSSLTINVVTEKRPERVIIDTLIHEIFHAIWFVWKLPEEGIDEEKSISALSTGWLTVLEDNPELRELLYEVLKNDKKD